MEPQNRAVGQKLGIATLCMCVLPVVAFFSVSWLVSQNNNTHPDNYGAAAAIVATNLVVAVYVWSAFREEDDGSDDKKKEQQPVVGIFRNKPKERTD